MEIVSRIVGRDMGSQSTAVQDRIWVLFVLSLHNVSYAVFFAAIFYRVTTSVKSGQFGSV